MIPFLPKTCYSFLRLDNRASMAEYLEKVNYLQRCLRKSETKVFIRENWCIANVCVLKVK